MLGFDDLGNDVHEESYWALHDHNHEEAAGEAPRIPSDINLRLMRAQLSTETKISS